MRRVKLSYTVNGYNKFVQGRVEHDDADFISVRSESKGDLITVSKKCIDEVIELGGAV